VRPSLLPKLAEALMGQVVDYAMAVWGRMLDAVGDLVHVLCPERRPGDAGPKPDLAADVPQAHQEVHQGGWYPFMREKSRAKILHHSCGSVHELLPDLIDCGVEILNPIQVTARTWSPSGSKKDFATPWLLGRAWTPSASWPSDPPPGGRGGTRRLIEVFGQAEVMSSPRRTTSSPRSGGRTSRRCSEAAVRER